MSRVETGTFHPVPLPTASLLFPQNPAQCVATVSALLLAPGPRPAPIIPRYGRAILYRDAAELSGCIAFLVKKRLCVQRAMQFFKSCGKILGLKPCLRDRGHEIRIT